MSQSKEAQSEAPSVDKIIYQVLTHAIEDYEAVAKINRLIDKREKDSLEKILFRNSPVEAYDKALERISILSNNLSKEDG